MYVIYFSISCFYFFKNDFCNGDGYKSDTILFYKNRKNHHGQGLMVIFRKNSKIDPFKFLIKVYNQYVYTSNTYALCLFFKIISHVTRYKKIVFHFFSKNSCMSRGTCIEKIFFSCFSKQNIQIVSTQCVCKRRDGIPKIS